MKPGRELDALVAEKVMGWKHETDSENRDRCNGEFKTRCGSCGALGHGNCYGYGRGSIQVPCDCTPYYSHNIETAFEIVEKIAPACNGEFRLERDESGQWECEIGYHVADACYPRIAKGETAPHAICLAALAVKK